MGNYIDLYHFKFKMIKSPTNLVDASRWIVKIFHSNDVAYLMLANQRRYTEDQKWFDCEYYYSIGIHKEWKFGWDNIQYDGIHKSIWIGFIQISWCNS